MITAVDTNILLDILVPNEAFYEASASALQDAAGGEFARDQRSFTQNSAFTSKPSVNAMPFSKATKFAYKG
jgi:hypothetical protein